MKNTDIEQLRKKLNWYIYECPYSDYNEQEVFYIINQLKEYNDEYEENIKSSHFTFNLKLLKNNQRKRKSRKVVIATISSVAIASSLFLVLASNSSSIAGLKIGFFNFLKNNDTGTQFFISPDKPESNVSIYTSDKIPEQYIDMVWLQVELPKYELSHIEVSDLKLSKVYYISKIDIDYITIFYHSESCQRTDATFIEAFSYNNVEISCFALTSDEYTEIYHSIFQCSSTKYCIESNNFEDAKKLTSKFIDFILR